MPVISGSLVLSIFEDPSRLGPKTRPQTLRKAEIARSRPKALGTEAEGVGCHFEGRAGAHFWNVADPPWSWVA